MKAETRNHFSDIADVWNNKTWVKSDEFSNEIINFASFNGNDVLLYLGIGTEDLAKKLPVKTVCGIDLSAKMLSKCKNIPRHNLIVGSAEKTPYLDETFNVTMSRNLLKHCEASEKVLKEMYRVLKPGGKVYIIESCVLVEEDKDPPNFCVRTVEPYHPSFQTHNEILSLITSTGFNLCKQKVYTFRSRWLTNWIKASKASDKIHNMVLDFYKEAPKGFIKRQEVRFIDNDIESNIFWSLIIAEK